LKMPTGISVAMGTDGWLWPTRRKSISFTGDDDDGVMPVRSCAEKTDRFAVCFMSSSADVTLATCSTTPTVVMDLVGDEPKSARLSRSSKNGMAVTNFAR
jgi:hypothetical protein